MKQGQMSLNVSFVNDFLSRRVLRSLLLLEVLAMIFVVGFSLRRLFFPALILSVATLFVFVTILFWLYARYRSLAIIREKKELEKLSLKFRKRIRIEETNIETAVRWRAELFQAEREERKTALQTLQAQHIQFGLSSAALEEADLPGIDPMLKSRLAEHKIGSAADITEQTPGLSFLTEAQCQTLITWRSSVLDHLEQTKPESLPETQAEAIQKKYRVLVEENSTAHRNAYASKQMLEYELISFRERLRQLTSFTFPSYLSRSLASRGMVAGALLSILVLTQIVSAVSIAASTAFSLLASFPR